MTVIHRLFKLVADFVTPVEHDMRIDTTTYHSAPKDGELRFSPQNALRRHY
jgi:hypothetical protein